jgi:peroxiredoxin
MLKKSIPILLLLTLCKFAVAQKVGTTAPDFTHTTLDHGTISLSDYRGRIVYLFFFGWD